jgi:hypothetical protein
LNYDAGRVENEVLGPRRHRGSVHEWNSHHPLLCRMHCAIKAEIYTAMGCKHAQIERRFCRSDGDPGCGSIIVWD